MIRFQGVTRIFPKTGAGIGEFTGGISTGEWVTLLGPSGCGKTTLLRLMAGLEIPTSGGISNPFPVRERAFVFQESALLPWLTAIENVMLPLRIRGISVDEARSRADTWLEKLRIARHGDSRPDELSGGMKMRVSLARALVTDPRLLLLDEPFAALDEPIRIELGLELRDLFRSLRPTIVMVTHSITEALWLSDRVMLFQGQPGRLALDQKVDLGEERTLAQRGEPRFAAQVEECFRLLRGTGI
jgi:NitT/TauT family transport system ATP-binding protein